MSQRRCECCHFPITDGGIPVCAQCAMIADGRTYGDGSSPSDDLHAGEIAYVAMRVASIRQAAANPAVGAYVAWIEAGRPGPEPEQLTLVERPEVELASRLDRRR